MKQLEKIKLKWSRMLAKIVLFIYGNAPAHKSVLEVCIICA